MKSWEPSYLGVAVDMAGCPNRCRHCWLGSHRNGNIGIEEFRGIAQQFRDWRDASGQGIRELSFFTWWREPDYRDDYRELWTLEQALSSPGRAQRYELLSTWRLARDPSYAPWAASVGPKACQITFFGLEDSTDWGMRRKGAFADQLLATERCLQAGIAPRWQLFLTKRCLGELEAFTHLIHDLDLRKRCEAIGRKFEVFIGGMSPEGNGYEIDGLRLEEDDLRAIPPELAALSRDGLSTLGEPESKLLETLRMRETPPEIEPSFPCIAIDVEYDAYPNIAEPTPWWRLGNLKTDGVDAVLKAYRDAAPPGMSANRTIPVAALAQRYGDPAGKRLYHPDDLLCRFMHQWGVEHHGGR